MAVELTIEEGRWSPRRLRAFVEGWLPQAPVRVLSTTAWRTSSAGTWTWMFAEGSTRGCSLRLKTSLVRSGLVVLRLNTLASRADWTLAHGLIRSLLKSGGGRALSGEGTVLRAEDLSDSAVAGEALSHMRDDLEALSRALGAGEPFAALPNPAFSLIVTPRLLPAVRDGARGAMLLEEQLRDMAARYHQADIVEPMQLPDGTSLSVWTRRAALIYFVHHVGVQYGETPDQGVVLQAPRALEILGDRLEVVSQHADRFFVPTLQPGEPKDEELLQRLVKAGQPLPEFMARYQQREAGMF